MSQNAILDSPCVRMCTLDDDDICIGCGRTLQEIKQWSSYTQAERSLLLPVCARRRDCKQQQRQYF